MKLSELIRLKRTIDSIFPGDYEIPLQNSLTSLVEIFNNNSKKEKMFIQDLKISREKIVDEFANIRQNLNDYKKYIQNCIEQQEDEFYKVSEEIYQNSFHDDAEYILNRLDTSKTFSDEENKNLFVSRLGMYNSWKYPALQIRPGFGDITDFIKGCDPLYLLDQTEDLFTEVKKKWNSIYQRRLRYYTFNESDTNVFEYLPNNQFGLILCVDYFNFKPLHIIEKFLQEFFLKLRPGGVVIFTYNNCNLPYAVRNVENRFCCYTPGNDLINRAENIGYELIKSFDKLENISWLEIKKPGEIQTTRGGQTLGEIRSFS